MIVHENCINVLQNGDKLLAELNISVKFVGRQKCEKLECLLEK